MSLTYSRSSISTDNTRVLIESLITQTFILDSLSFAILALYFNLMDWRGSKGALRRVFFSILYTSTILRGYAFLGFPIFSFFALAFPCISYTSLQKSKHIFIL
ncbi:hypothetical protein OCU04_001490 [Sclerotinia nivalis]|uniref:Uncharacterized protein n=1 Tax=Sclerotinia nivalis TaxID=352851 RepID=A0A9X0AY58_9HELO|nr:hypothetical protein OCU04_001490 [Sclerotinia nivalis]